jgi:hypothetical protein
LPAGTYVKCEAVFNNAASNPYNPDPDRVVTWGDQTWDEMLIGYFDVAVKLDSDAGSGGGPKPLPDQADEFILQRDTNDDFQLQVSELPFRIRLAAWRADTDKDGVISREELINFFRRERQRDR